VNNFKEEPNMKITINARQMTVRDSLKELVYEKLSKLDKYFCEEGDATVTFSRKRNNVNLEVTIYAANTLFRSETEDETFQNALDRSIDTIERQIRKNKTRLEKRLKEGVFENGDTADDYIDDEPEFKIRTKTFSFKPMSVEEAILQMNLLGHEFFVFEDQVTEDTCVVYKRKDGDYGLIVPER
jgi:putative sigma-54 modulation protein